MKIMWSITAIAKQGVIESPSWPRQSDGTFCINGYQQGDQLVVKFIRAHGANSYEIDWPIGYVELPRGLWQKFWEWLPWTKICRVAILKKLDNI